MILISVCQIKYAAIFLLLTGRKIIAAVTDNFQVDTLRFFSEDHFAFCHSGNDRSQAVTDKIKFIWNERKQHTLDFVRRIISKLPKWNKIWQN